jgi:hypothetical protein
MEDASLCLQSDPIYQAAATLRNRVKNILNNASFVGHSKSAPTEFLLAYGIVESMLYALRLYETVTDTYGHDIVVDQGSINMMIRDIEAQLTYDVDKLVRSLVKWSRFLDLAEGIVSAVTATGCGSKSSSGAHSSEKLATTR